MSPGEFTKEHLKTVKNRGFVVVEDCFAKEEVGLFRSSLSVLLSERTYEASDPRSVDNYMVHNPMIDDPLFFKMLENPGVVQAMDSLLGPTSILYAFTTSSMPGGGTNYSHRIHVDCPRVIPGYITNIGIICALDDFTAENGATYFLPESFERNDQPTNEEFLAGAEQVYPRAGDIIVFNARTWHLGGQNRTDRDRHALTINCCRSYMRQRFDYPRMCDQFGITLSPHLRRVMGYNVRMPTTLDDYYVPLSERLYLPNQG